MALDKTARGQSGRSRRRWIGLFEGLHGNSLHLFLLMVMRATDNVTQLQVSDKFSSSLQEDAAAAAATATLRVDDWCNGLPADRLGLWHLGVQLQEIVHGLPALDGGLLLWDLLQVSTGSYDERVLYMWNKT